MQPIQAVRGMNDLLPEEVIVWQHVERVVRQSFAAYDYREIRLPLIERTELFSRSIGEETDIVAKEMYTFDDRNGENLTLRPEGTAGCVRAAIENGLLHNPAQRWWYMGPMFRYERPQRGRYRQFHQAGAEAFGWMGPDIDAELIALSARMWRALGLKGVELEINSLGSVESRIAYRERLVEYLERYRGELDADSQRRLDTNPLRILDSKDANTQAILSAAPDIRDHLDGESHAHFETLVDLLQRLGIAYRVNSRLVRGLDYYSRTVFEWVSSDLGAQATVCAGGRYDGLVDQLGGRRPTPAAGFAVGLERLVEIVLAQARAPDQQSLDVYVATLGEAATAAGLLLAEALRDAGYSVQNHCGGGSLKSQIKRADKSGARVAAILGHDELQTDSVTLKPLRIDADQETVQREVAAQRIARLIGIDN